MFTYEYPSKTGGRFIVLAPRTLSQAEQREMEREMCDRSSTDCAARKEPDNATMD